MRGDMDTRCSSPSYGSSSSCRSSPTIPNSPPPQNYSSIMPPGTMADVGALAITITDSVYESAAKLLFLGVKWARSIPSFMQVRFSNIL